MPFDMKSLTPDVAAATSSTIIFGAIGGQTDTAPTPIPITILSTYFQSVISSGPANPTASLGLTAINGSATTFMRSDAAPALSQSIVPTWTGQHTFNAQMNIGAAMLWSSDNATDIGAAGANRPRNVYVGTTLIAGTVQSPGALQFQIVGANSVWQITSSGHLTANSDTNNDIGASNANRPRALYLGGALATATPNTQSGTSYSMSATDSSLIFTNAGAVTLTLQAASSFFGRWLYIKETGAGAVSSASSNVVPLGGGAAGTAITTAAGKFALLQSDGTNWIIMVAN